MNSSPMYWRTRYPTVMTQLWNLSGTDPSLFVADLARNSPHKKDAEVLEMAFKHLL